jgi:D-3-phosphoglycerate dehydrogenase
MTNQSTSFKVVLADTTAPDYDVEQEVFLDSDLDLDVRYLQTRNPAEFGPAVADADAVVLSWAPFTREVIAGLAKCRLIVRYGIGVDMIDLDAATEAGILVCNTARYCIDEVSTHAIAFLLMLNRQMLPQIDAIRTGGWGARDVLPPRRLKGQRLGLIGSGNIGVATAAKARGLGLETVAYDPFLQQRNVQIPDVPLLSLDEVLATSDYVSIHCPLNASTFHSIGARELGLMKPSAFLINCARGAIVDQAALAAALAAKQIAGAGLDVVEKEPLPADDPLRGLANAIITPHAAHWSVESSIECRRTAIEHVITFLNGKIPADVVNRAVLERGLRKSE